MLHAWEATPELFEDDKGMRGKVFGKVRLAGVVLMFLLACVASANASVNATLLIGGSERSINGAWDEGNITIAFNGFYESVHYDRFSSSASIASAFAGTFSRDYIAQGLCAIASGSTITFHLKGTATFGPLSITNPSASFSFSPSGWANGGQVSLAVACAPSSFPVGQMTNCSAQLSPAGPTGTITFGIDSPDDPTIWQTDNVNTSGGATANGGLGNLPAGTYTVTAYYSGDSTFSPVSSSTQVTVTGSGGATGLTLYSYSVAYEPNDVVAGFSDSVMGTWTADYDALNRLLGIEEATGPTDPNSPKVSFTNYCWSYDSFGNRRVNAASNTEFPSDANGNAVCSPQNYPSFGYNANSQVSSGPAVPSYDQAGNITADNNGDGNQYLYDAEGRVCAVQRPPVNGIPLMTGYVYDAEGRRVAKGRITSWNCDPFSNGLISDGGETDFILDQSGHQVTEMTEENSTMTWIHSNVWSNGQLLGTYSRVTGSNGQPDGELHFYLYDWLGTRRVQTDYKGTWEADCVSLPFGDEESCSPTPTEHLFTGKERDSESGNDYFLARYYGSSMGRFLSPDDGDGGGDDPGDPQSLNLYSYVQNNPLTSTDPSGHDCVSQTRVNDTTVSVTVTSGGSPGGCGSGTYVPGTVNSVTSGKNGTSIDVGYTPYSDAGGAGVMNINAASNGPKMDEGAVIPGDLGLGLIAGWKAGGLVGDLFRGAVGWFRGAGAAAGGAAAGEVTGQIALRVGGIIDRVFQTTAGPVRVYCEVVPEGTTAVVKDLAIYPADSSTALDVGYTQMRQGLRQMGQELKEQGFDSMRVENAYRVSGATPGRFTTFTTKLK